MAKLAIAGALLAAVEVFLAKLRLFRVPELLAGSFVLAFLAVTASYLVVQASRCPTPSTPSSIGLSRRGPAAVRGPQVWRHSISAEVRLLAVQGGALGGLVIVLGVHEQSLELLVVAGIVLTLKAVVLPWAADPGRWRGTVPRCARRRR